MEIALSDKKLRKVMEDALIDILVHKPELFRKMLVDIIEDIGLANAIKEARKNEFVPEERIMRLLPK